MDRRDFIKSSAAAAAVVGLASCGLSRREQIKLGQVPHSEEGPSLLGFGAMRWPKDAESGEIDQEAVNSMVDAALAHGVNYFDTAPVYLGGKSERATAIALGRHPREEWLLATKLSTFRGPFSLDRAKEMYLKSLETFNTDWIDYYLFHSIDDAADFAARYETDGIAEYFLEERRQGRIRNLGFSFHGSREGLAEMLSLHGKYHWDFIQIQMNYMDWKHPSYGCDAEYMYNAIREKGIPIIIMEPLLGGQLASLPAAAADELKSREPDATLASWSFRFCASFPGVISILSGMSCEEHLTDNIATFSKLKPLSSEDFSLLENVADTISRFPLIGCTGCSYCMPCPFGIDIPGVFAFYNKEVKAGTYVVSATQKNFSRLKKQYLKRYASAVLPERQADHCISCGKCVRACPQHIDIPKELHNFDRYLENLKQETL